MIHRNTSLNKTLHYLFVILYWYCLFSDQEAGLTDERPKPITTDHDFDTSSAITFRPAIFDEIDSSIGTMEVVSHGNIDSSYSSTNDYNGKIAYFEGP